MIKRLRARLLEEVIKEDKDKSVYDVAIKKIFKHFGNSFTDKEMEEILFQLYPRPLDNFRVFTTTQRFSNDIVEHLIKKLTFLPDQLSDVFLIRKVIEEDRYGKQYEVLEMKVKDKEEYINSYYTPIDIVKGRVFWEDFFKLTYEPYTKLQTLSKKCFPIRQRI